MSKKVLIPTIVCLLLCFICLFLYFRDFLFPPADDGIDDVPVSTQIEDVRSQIEETVPEPVKTETETKAEESEPYVSPVDFEALQEASPDIYAWLSIPGSDISYPLLQSDDDTFYLDHNESGEPSSRGALFTESAYNGKTLDDTITVIYGHHMRDGSMFGNLQEMYSGREAISEHREILIYMPDRELTYQVFAAVPYDNRHIPYNYGDGSVRGILSFLDSISSVKSLDASFDEAAFAASDDKLVVLSTCLRGDRSGRFLVIAKLVE